MNGAVMAHTLTVLTAVVGATVAVVTGHLDSSTYAAVIGAAVGIGGTSAIAAQSQSKSGGSNA